MVLKKTIEVNEKDLFLKTKIEFLKGFKSLEGLQTVFSEKLPEQAQQNFLIKMLTMYGKNRFKGFVFFQGKRNLFFEEDMEDKKTYTGVSIGALGGKYFGKAFVNKSSLSPSLEVEKVDDEILARATYLFSKEKIKSLEYLSFFGPKSSKTLKPLGEEAKSWIDFGFFSWLSHPLLALLNLFYKVSSNWGIAIIFLTFFIRLCLLPINIKSYESMKKMQEIQPKIKDLKDEYKDDPKKLNLEVMALMKENKANPLQGCFPLFFQMPIFFALYRVLGESIELYQAPFLFWVNDLSLKDPFYVLPVLAGATLFVQQKLTPMNMPAAQARLLVFMPVLFSVFMLGLPSGLTLYIFISGLFGLVQQAFFLKFKSHT